MDVGIVRLRHKLVVIVTDLDPQWPAWRGPNRDGKSSDTGLLKSWPEGGPKQLWKVTGIGQGFSNVSLGGGLIYITGRKDIAKAYIGYYKGARATPTYDKGNLYLELGMGEIGCFDVVGSC